MNADGGALREEVRCAPMSEATRADARALLGAFLRDDAHYRATAAAYGDGGAPALERALGAGRIDSACHRANAGAWRFYERLGFRPLDEERIARLL